MTTPIESTLDENKCDRNTYGLIAIAIAFIRQNHLQQPDLAAIAAIETTRNHQKNYVKGS